MIFKCACGRQTQCEDSVCQKCRSSNVKQNIKVIIRCLRCNKIKDEYSHSAFETPGMCSKCLTTTHPAFKKAVRRAMKRWSINNPEKARIKQNAHQKRWRINNPEKVKVKAKRRDACKRGAVMVESYTNREIFERDDWICYICQFKLDPKEKDPRWQATVDHVKSLHGNGDHTRKNSRCACRSCNAWKCNREVTQAQILERRKKVNTTRYHFTGGQPLGVKVFSNTSTPVLSRY